jgi:transmembrane sensor
MIKQDNNGYFLEILRKYNAGTATQEEKDFLESYYALFEEVDDLIDEQNEAHYYHIKHSIKEAADQTIDKYTKKGKTHLRVVWIRVMAIAAIFLLFLSVSVYVFTNQKGKSGQDLVTAEHMVAGKNKAILTLANGNKIVLDDAHQGEVATQGSTSIIKSATGEISYRQHPAGKTDTGNNYQAENNITVPAGGQFMLNLPDGTKVWLNALSSLTYPSHFVGNQRLVTLKGEAYFEVTKNKHLPFRVKTGLQTIEVLGTHFNINDYDNEAAIKTTLLEGAVKVSFGTGNDVLAPGEQTAVNHDGAGGIKKYKVNTDKEVAWKNGLFSFNNDDVKTIMRQVSRWYNVDVVYDDNLPDEKYFGEISRSSNLAQVFKILELNNLAFKLQGKTVHVSSKK